MNMERRFNGPPDSANGGYVCGRLAALLGAGPVRVRLHRPPPLRRHLTWDGARLLDDDTLVAEAAAWSGERPALPPAVTLEQARAAAAGFAGLAGHPFPTCFGCGPDRAAGDGLRIFPGPVPGTSLLAAPWLPGPTTTRGDAVATAIAWAALDCPGGWACADPSSTAVLAGMTAQLLAPVPPHEELVLTARSAGVDGRKRHAVCALRTAAGELLGWSQQLWVELR